MMRDLFPFYSIGHFINQPKNPTEFEILRFENMEEPEVEDRHKHSFYEILWVEKGTSLQTIDYLEFEVKPNSLFFISPNQVHQFEEWKPLSGGTILFTEDFYLLNRSNRDTLLELSFLDNLYGNPCIVFTKKDFESLLHLIQQLETEHQRPDRKSSIIQSYLHILLTQVQRHLEASEKSASNSRYLVLFKRFKQILEIHFDENRTASFYAGELAISPHHLNLICKEVSNKTSSEIIRERRMLEVKRLLTYSDKTISEIAFELNFADSSYLSRNFKLSMGLSPGEFKENILAKHRTSK